jgi:hypothetical protein
MARLHVVIATAITGYCDKLLMAGTIKYAIVLPFNMAAFL